MLLKGELSKRVPLDELKAKFGHKLPRIWAAYKALFPSEDLTEFDPMIAAIEKFESIRYPDEIVDRGAIITLGFGRDAPVLYPETESDRPEPKFQIGLGDLDAFFARCFPLCRLNPQAYFLFLSSYGRSALEEGNDKSINWLP